MAMVWLGLGLAVLGVLAAWFGVDSRDSQDWRPVPAGPGAERRAPGGGPGVQPDASTGHDRLLRTGR